jgi:hypothetical protein
MLTEAQFQRLKPFLSTNTAKTRVILYLLADGIGAETIAKMTVRELKAIRVSAHIETEIQLLIGDKGMNEGAVSFENRAFTPRRVIERLNLACRRVIGKTLTPAQFSSYIKKGVTNQ